MDGRDEVEKGGCRGAAAVAAVAVGVLLSMGGCTDDPSSDGPTGMFGEPGEPMPGLSEERRALFERGETMALERFTPEEGLGPGFNVTFCASCHEKPTQGGGGPRYRDFMLGGFELPQGSRVDLGQNGIIQHFHLEEGRAVRTPNPEQFNLAATRNAIPFFGVGLLAEIPESEIRSRTDPADADGDGISGRANEDDGRLGRFGLKAQATSLEGFVRPPMHNHLGVTSDALSDARRRELPMRSLILAGEEERDDEGRTVGGLGSGDTGTKKAGQGTTDEDRITDGDDAPDPELSPEQLFEILSWVQLLAAPEPDEPTEVSERGRRLFGEIGCTGCHVPELDGPRGPVPAYSDLLLHEMGPELADGFSQKKAAGDEFRTQPLWGVAAVGPWLHDGRADSLDEAIRLHGGEAAASRDAYEDLDDGQRDAVLAFLRSLGGSDAQREGLGGLIEPGRPIRPVGEFGGPRRELDAEEEARFLEGRRVFDRDTAFSEGLGPHFNGDACRSCHFDPVHGGAGPLGVNVTRQGFVDPDTHGFTPPEDGTVLPTFSRDLDERPSEATPSEEANEPPEDEDMENRPPRTVLEGRQAPPLFGVGLLSDVPAEALRERADPDDADGDGISGEVHELPNGRVGRLGWKAQVPDSEEFLRDAAGEELGVTVPEFPEEYFGILGDDDGHDDPEMSEESYQALRFYLDMLAPPPREAVDTEREERGRELFEEVGCNSCHAPELPLEGGGTVRAYTDLLLHAVRPEPPEPPTPSDEPLPEGARGIVQGEAGVREFRTPPLWGVRDTAPYLHDGSASTLDAAIRAHAGEASEVRDDYEALDESERGALRDFLRTL